MSILQELLRGSTPAITVPGPDNYGIGPWCFRWLKASDPVPAMTVKQVAPDHRLVTLPAEAKVKTGARKVPPTRRRERDLFITHEEGHLVASPDPKQPAILDPTIRIYKKLAKDLKTCSERKRLEKCVNALYMANETLDRASPLRGILTHTLNEYEQWLGDIQKVRSLKQELEERIRQLE